MTDANGNSGQQNKGVFEDDEGLLDQQTEGLDAGETSAIAGPDWDEDLVKDAESSTPGETLDGRTGAASSASSQNCAAPALATA